MDRFLQIKNDETPIPSPKRKQQQRSPQNLDITNTKRVTLSEGDQNERIEIEEGLEIEKIGEKLLLDNKKPKVMEEENGEIEIEKGESTQTPEKKKTKERKETESDMKPERETSNNGWEYDDLMMDEDSNSNNTKGSSKSRKNQDLDECDDEDKLIIEKEVKDIEVKQKEENKEYESEEMKVNEKKGIQARKEQS